MSVVAGMMQIIRDEMAKHGVSRLLSVRVRCGALGNVVPEALSFAFEALTAGTDMEGARMELETVPVRLSCSLCGEEFEPPRDERFAPCPRCDNRLGHAVLSGRELYIDHIEAE